MAHRLFKHKGKCNHIHGHRYTVAATVIGELDEDGMVVDFANLKNIMEERIVDKHDHSVAINKEDSVMLDFLVCNNFKFILYDKDPTAEVMAEEFYRDLSRWFDVHSVSVWETPTSFASYKGKEEEE
ncbi:MAG: 6-pyruvoyl trahydropterin synthase family protein [Planctomycetota bacterium]|jgi:6-pyruvoyltetrahydropterin/6-carboxytetrahydropterin synthase